MAGVKVNFSANDAGFTSTVSKVNQSMKGMDNNVSKVSASVKTSFAAMAKAGAALAVGFGAIKAAAAAVRNTFDAFGQALDMGGRLSDLQASTGAAAGEILVLERAFQNAGAGAEKAGPALNKMQRAIVEAGQGVTTYQKAFAAMGVNFDELRQKTPSEQFSILAKKISEISDPAERATASMQIFGRSGAKLLPLFGDFENGISTAREQLGLLPAIMDKMNGQFDTISDNIAVVREKFAEFAAGVLSKIAPMLELITDRLSKVDAAAAGARLAEVFVGAGEAMAGFQKALDAFRMGEFVLGMKATWTSIKLQVVETINSIYANFKGAMAGIKTLVAESGISLALTSLFKGIANEITSTLRNAIADFLQAIGKLGAAKEMRLFSEADKQRAENYFTLAKAGFSQLGENLVEANQKAKEAFKKGFDGAGEAISTSKLKKELDTIEQQINSMSGIMVKDAQWKPPAWIAEVAKMQQEVTTKPLRESVTIKQNFKEAGRALADSSQKVLAASEKLKEELVKAQAEQPLNRQVGQVRQAIEKGDFRRAEREIAKLQAKEAEMRVQERFGDPESKIAKSIKDIAKEQGVDTFRKTTKQLLAELDKLAKEPKKEGKPGDADEMKKKKEPIKEPDKDQLPKMVQGIKMILERLERKLPTPALS